MKNLVQDGDILQLLAPYDVLSGAGFQVGSIFAVAEVDALSGVALSGRRVGVINLKKAGSQAWTVGVRVYWDNTAKQCTTTATSNLFIGFAAAAVDSAAGSTQGDVLLAGASGAGLGA